LLAAFGATGVDRVLMPTDMTGIAAAVLKNSHGRQARSSHWPALEFDLTLRQSVEDTRLAARWMAERGVALIAVLGGDGTHKAVAAEVGDIPLLTLSTGTNNAFPELREATSAGLAGGLFVSGRIPPGIACAATNGCWCASRVVACARWPWWRWRSAAALHRRPRHQSRGGSGRGVRDFRRTSRHWHLGPCGLWCPCHVRRLAAPGCD
jgi:hypothetical protein